MIDRRGVLVTRAIRSGVLAVKKLTTRKSLKSQHAAFGWGLNFPD